MWMSTIFEGCKEDRMNSGKKEMKSKFLMIHAIFRTQKDEDLERYRRDVERRGHSWGDIEIE